VVTTPSIVASELQVEYDVLLGPEAVTADAAPSRGEIPAPAYGDTIADDKPLRAVLRLDVDLLQEGSGLITHCFQVTGRRNFPRIFLTTVYHNFVHWTPK
jgi:hypothetical protein